MKRFLVAMLALTLGATVLGCSSSDSTGASPTALLRVAHLSPDAPAVDVWVDGSAVLEGVPFTAVSGYLPVTAGTRRIQVTPAGAPGTVVLDADVALAAGQAYTVVATGLLGASDLTPLVLEDSLSPGGSNALVRFVHVSPDAPAVDVAVTGGPILFEGFAFREASDYASVAAGSRDLEVRVAGTATVALAIPGASFAAGTSTTVFAIGLAGDGSLAALPVIDSP